MRTQCFIRVRRACSNHRALTALFVGVGVALAAASVAPAAAADCLGDRKKLGAAKRKIGQLQGKFRKLLVIKAPSDAQTAELTKIQGDLASLSDQTDTLESALKACPGGAKAKVAKTKPPKKPKARKARPVTGAVAAATPPTPPAPPPALSPPAPTTPAADSAAASFSSVSAAPPAPSATPPRSEPVCSGGPTASVDADASGTGVAPPSLSSWRSRLSRHAANRRAVDWATEAPERCADRAGTITRGAP